VFDWATACDVTRASHVLCALTVALGRVSPAPYLDLAVGNHSQGLFSNNAASPLFALRRRVGPRVAWRPALVDGQVQIALPTELLSA
jgi:hypothetical protein